MTVTGFGTNSLSIEITLNNTSPNTGVGGDRLTAFAFGIDPNATSVTFSDTGDGGMTNAGFVTTGAMPSNVQWCRNLCLGWPELQRRIERRHICRTERYLHAAAGRHMGTQVNIDPIGLRYQTGNGSFTFPAGNGTSVPEPGSLALLGLGIFGAGLARRRAKRA
jgi:hypothetical protein